MFDYYKVFNLVGWVGIGVAFAFYLFVFVFCLFVVCCECYLFCLFGFVVVGLDVF